MGGNSDLRHPAYPHAELVQAARELVAALRRSCPIDAEPQTPAGKAADLFGEGPSAGAGPDSVGSAWEEFGPLTSWLNVTLPEDPPLEPGIPQPTKAAIYAIYTNTNRSLLGAMLRFYETYYGKVWPRIKEARERNMSRATLPTFSSQDLDEFLSAANYLAEVAGVRGDGSPGAHQTPAKPRDVAFGVDSPRLPTAGVADNRIATPKGEAGGGDTMPQEPSRPVCESKAVKLFGPGEQPEVNGKRKRTLTRAQYDAVGALIRAGENGLTKDELDRKSGHGDARKTLKRLAENDRDWRKVLSFPGTTGKGYRIL